MLEEEVTGYDLEALGKGKPLATSNKVEKLQLTLMGRCSPLHKSLIRSKKETKAGNLWYCIKEKMQKIISSLGIRQTGKAGAQILEFQL